MTRVTISERKLHTSDESGFLRHTLEVLVTTPRLEVQSDLKITLSNVSSVCLNQRSHNDCWFQRDKVITENIKAN